MCFFVDFSNNNKGLTFVYFGQKTVKSKEENVNQLL